MEQPLVSIVVITYNSAKTVVETLESAKNQTYKNIELIVSDDCSTDETVEICRNWIAENKDRFVRTELITVEKNTGIPGNLNRAYEKTNGEWIKGLAGDDIFLSNCIEDNVSFVKNNPEMRLLFSYAKCFSIKNGKYIELGNVPKNQYLTFFEKNHREQLMQLYKECFIPAPTCFIESSLAKENPYSDEYRNLEDYPQWIRLTKNGCKLYFMPKSTIAYRVGDSVSRNRKKMYNISYVKDLFYFQDTIREERLKYYPRLVKEQDFERKLFDFFITYFNNKKNIFTISLRKVLKIIYRLSLNLF